MDTLFEIAVNSNWRSLFDYEEEIDCDNEELNCMSDDKEDDELVDNCFSKKKT